MSELKKNQIKTQLPTHYSELYQRFIQFLEKYYEFLHRNVGMCKEEVDIIKSEKINWIKTNIDNIVNGENPYLNFDSGDEGIDFLHSLIELHNYKGPGFDADKFTERYLLERNFESLLTDEDEYFETSDGYLFETCDKDERFLKSWFNKLSFPFINDEYEVLDSEISGYNDYIQKTLGSRYNFNMNIVDKILLIRMLKHIHSIKGTKKSIELFFSIFFGENIIVYYPKFDIASLDFNFNLDGKETLRDDVIYQEYSYVIYTEQDPSYYEDVFNSIYLKYLHPSGFNVSLLQNTV